MKRWYPARETGTHRRALNARAEYSNLTFGAGLPVPADEGTYSLELFETHRVDIPSLPAYSSHRAASTRLVSSGRLAWSRRFALDFARAFSSD